MTDDIELQSLKQRLDCLESKLSDDRDSNVVPGRVLTATRHDYHLSIVLLLNDPENTQVFLDEILGADSLPEAQAKLTQIKNRKSRYKRKAMILKPTETWKNFT